MSVLRKLVSLGYWLLDNEKSISDFRKRAVSKEEDFIAEKPSAKIISPLVITAHVFYPEFAAQLIDSLKLLPKETKVFATTPSQEIKQNLESYLEVAGNPHDVRLTPNIGRNFCPLLVEFSKDLLKEESFVHVHSKKSLHSPEIASDWLKRNTDLLLSMEGLQRISSVTEANSKIGLAYVDASDLLWGINFRWGRSRRITKRNLAQFPGFELISWSGRIKFPGGGMFWVKSSAIRPLLEINWKYEMFRNESYKNDGDFPHGLERMIGALSSSRGFLHAVFHPKRSSFWVDNLKI
jgi:lipopolysaccharide biosynthesis protein